MIHKPLTKRLMENQIRLHLVLIPPPLKGHITPMLQLATILHSKGFFITIAHTHFNSPNPSNHPNFNFLPFFDGLSNTQITSKNFIDIASSLNTNCVTPLKESLVHHIAKLEKHGEKIACVIYDGFFHFIDSLAKELKLPSIVFRTTSATNILTYHVCAHLQTKGYLPLQDSKPSDLVPELDMLRFKDLPIFNLLNPHDFLHGISKTLSITPLAVIFNTVETLEDSSLNHLQHLYNVNIFPIGPLHMISNESNNISILPESDRCISWLNNKPRKSVLYVSLGSIASWEEKELTEMACGLSNSRQNFLWVIRPETVTDVSAWLESLSEDVKVSVAERGCIVKWAPQSEVLAHEAVGGFWSHCGWNSTLESLCEGIPIICQPYFGDQRVNARLLSHVWKVGLEWCNVMKRDEIEKVVRRLMVNQEGEELRKRAFELKHEIRLALNGSSCDALNGLVKCILSVNV
ncbi:UDP-glucose iridoid glucosyltransferase-like [Vicia villosa]|uniref:UDP-glucose iridoid glucosyltransferase-like n=1 Tax=Vicia villosa TaxID=3911 RepID=UPI00273B4972|nr:UDP-glucose iridoid glucosyltransferase-like [Vicia villosa]